MQAYTWRDLALKESFAPTAAVSNLTERFSVRDGPFLFSWAADR